MAAVNEALEPSECFSKDERSYEDWLQQMWKNGGELSNVPETLKTAELCLEAVRSWGRALEYVPEPLKTAELCLEAVKNNGFALEYVPETLKTADLCLKAVEDKGLALKYVRTIENYGTLSGSNKKL